MSQQYAVCPRCGRRAGDFMDTCPNCGLELRPRPPRSQRSRLWLFIPALLLTVCVGWVGFRVLSTGLLARALGLEVIPPPTSTPVVIYVVATSSPPTPTIPPTITLTPTAQFSPTPRRTGAPTPTLTRFVATPPAANYPAPQLINPPNGSRFRGKDMLIAFSWKPVAISLAEYEWYRISITFTGRDGKPTERIGWAKEPQWEIVPDWWGEISPSMRTVTWNVTVVHVDSVDPFASPTFVSISARSTLRAFTWE